MCSGGFSFRRITSRAVCSARQTHEPSRRREVADAAALSGMKRIKMRMRDAFMRIGEL